MTADTAFNPTQYAHPYPDGIEAHYWTHGRHRILRRLLRGRLREGGTLLDIGCGRGITVAYLREQGIDAWGCELARPEPISAAVAPYLSLGTETRDLPEDLRRSVDLILLLDVLEHLPDPRALLSQCAVAFPACRNVIVTVPARMELWSNYDVYYGHQRRYDPGSLASLYPPDAYALEAQGYFFHLLYPAARVLAAVGKERSVEVRAPGPGQRWAHRLLGEYFDWEQRLCPGGMPGTSLYAVLSRTSPKLDGSPSR